MREGRRARFGWVALGVGVGAFVDGIVLHQLLQWHHMASASRTVQTVAGLELNTVADGFFHVGALIVTLIAVWLIGTAQLVAPSGPARVGLALAGWGGFNIAEGVVDHHLLGVHHVRDDVANSVPWDVGFLVLSGAFLAAGVSLARRST